MNEAGWQQARGERDLATILVIDDSDSARAEIRSALGASGRVGTILEAADGLAGLRLLLAHAVDAVICDLEMPGLDGEKLLAACRTQPGREEVPFLFLTANRDPERLARLLRRGASDTILKPFHPVELIARLELQLRLMRLQAELREKNATLARISTTDLVTGLRTRRYVGELLAIEVLRATRYRMPLAVLMADLDHFKRVNDEHGHRAGDAVLAGVGEVIRGALRACDAAGRYGGEEIVIVLPQTDLEGAGVLAERLRQAIEHAAFDIGGGVRLGVTVSIGVAALDGKVRSAEELVEAADAALYGAKAAGRNRVALAPGLRGVDTPAGSRTPEPARGRKP
jgi:diguanylate cyclase (GGDEF)-like protein